MHAPVAVPGDLQQSPLFTNGGFAVYEGLVDAPLRQQLLAEAFARHATAQRQFVLRADREENRGGSPERSLSSASGGPLLNAFYHSAWLLDFLQQTTHLPLKPAGAQGSYSYYVQPGDFLGLHRDIVSCELTLITTLYDNSGGEERGGLLCLYPRRWQQPLSAIRATPAEGAVHVRLQPGQTLLLLGGIVPHALLPVQAQQRIVSLLCFSW